MASDAGPKAGALQAGALLAAMGLAGLGFGVGLMAAAAPARLLVLAALAALALLALLWHCLARLAQGHVPAPALERAPVDAAQRALLDNALALEAALEHAPVALFRIDAGAAAAANGNVDADADADVARCVAPLNASARRLVAPGRASDPAALYRALAAQPDGRRCLIHFETERGAERALAATAALALHGQPQRLAALMPVESELEAEALQAWRRLVHVLTHEIMNSLTPVASLSRSAHELVEASRAALAADVGADLVTALDAIARRADSLVDFVTGYRSLANVPAAQPQRVALGALFERVAALVGPDWRARGGAVALSVEPGSLELMVDPGQLEQALINLLKNAFEATAGGPGRASVAARLVRGSRLRIEVSDDGPGIPEGLAAHIFTPFFTTKKQGGGIGLALVRHLIHENGGTVRHARPLGRGARFIITF